MRAGFGVRVALHLDDVRMFWQGASALPKPEAALDQCGDFSPLGGGDAIEVPCDDVMGDLDAALRQYSGIREQAWGFTTSCWESCRSSFSNCW